MTKDVQLVPRALAQEGESEVYEISPAEAKIPAEWISHGAVYTLEAAARCPYCRQPTRTLRVLRLSRTQVAFTSTLPRSGRAVCCPNCDAILSAEVSGLL